MLSLIYLLTELSPKVTSGCYLWTGGIIYTSFAEKVHAHAITLNFELNSGIQSDFLLTKLKQMNANVLWIQ